MKILIVSATSIEVKPLVSEMHFIEKKNSKLNSYQYKNFLVDILITGVGMVSTAFCLGKAFATYDYNAAINIGIAGSFDKKINIGDVVNVYNDKFPELGAEDGEYFLSLIDLNLIEGNNFSFENGEIINNSSFKSNILKDLRKVKGITVNTVSGNSKNIERTIKETNPDIESMEGAAFLYACLNENIDCIQLRAISNYVEQRNKNHWNIPLAIENVNKKVIEILNE